MRRLACVMWAVCLAVIIGALGMSLAVAAPALGQQAQGPQERNSIHGLADQGLVKLESPRFT